MRREIIINATPRETRIAILEDKEVAEILVERPEAVRRTVETDRDVARLVHRA